MVGSDRYFVHCGRDQVTAWNDDPAILFTHGDGPIVFDADGGRYIDYICGIGPVVLGHADEEFNTRLSESLRSGLSLPGYGRAHGLLAERFEQAQPGKRVVSLFKTSSEAVTAAIRCATMMTGRSQVIRCGFLGWHDHLIFNSPNWHEPLHSSKRYQLSYKKGFRGVSGADSVHNWLDLSIESLIAILDAAGDLAAAFAIDIYQLAFMSADTLKTAVTLCRQKGIAIVFDETKTSGRTSPVGYLKDFPLDPDFIILGKAIGNGAPISVLLGDDAHAGIYRAARIGGTHSKDLFSVSAASHVMDIMADRDGYKGLMRAGTAFCEVFNAAATATGAACIVKAVPLFDGTILDLHWSQEFIDRTETRIALVAALRSEGVLILHAHCSFVSASHLNLDPQLVEVRLTKALASWLQTLS